MLFDPSKVDKLAKRVEKANVKQNLQKLIAGIKYGEDLDDQASTDSPHSTSRVSLANITSQVEVASSGRLVRTNKTVETRNQHASLQVKPSLACFFMSRFTFPTKQPSHPTFAQLCRVFEDDCDYSEEVRNSQVNNNWLQTIFTNEGKQQDAERMASQTRTIVHANAVELFQTILRNRKQHVGIPAFIKGLLTKRIVSYTVESNNLTSVCQDNSVMQNAIDWNNGPCKTNGFRDIELAALLCVSGPTLFVHNGAGDFTNFQRFGIMVAQCGFRFDHPSFMNALQVNKDAASNFRTEDQVQQHLAFAEFYGINKPRQPHLPSIQFKQQVYALHVQHLATLFLVEANQRGAEFKKHVFCRVSDLGISKLVITDEDRQNMMQAYVAAYLHVLRKCRLDFIACVEFRNLGKHENHKINNVNIVFNDSNLADKLDNDKLLLVVQYCSDAMTLPGNEYWQAKFDASENAQAASCSCIAQLANPLVNPCVYQNLWLVKRPERADNQPHLIGRGGSKCVVDSKPRLACKTPRTIVYKNDTVQIVMPMDHFLHETDIKLQLQCFLPGLDVDSFSMFIDNKWPTCEYSHDKYPDVQHDGVVIESCGINGKSVALVVLVAQKATTLQGNFNNQSIEHKFDMFMSVLVVAASTMIHCDIKLDKFLVDRSTNVCKLSDAGLAVFKHENLNAHMKYLLKNSGQNLGQMYSTTILQDSTKNRQYRFAAYFDMWSFCAMAGLKDLQDRIDNRQRVTWKDVFDAMMPDKTNMLDNMVRTWFNKRSTATTDMVAQRDLCQKVWWLLGQPKRAPWLEPFWCAFSGQLNKFDVDAKVDVDGKIELPKLELRISEVGDGTAYTQSQANYLFQQPVIQYVVNMARQSVLDQLEKAEQVLLKLTNKSLLYTDCLAKLDQLYIKAHSWAKLDNNSDFMDSPIINNVSIDNKLQQIANMVRIQDLCHAPSWDQLGVWLPAFGGCNFVDCATSDEYVVGLCRSHLVVKHLSDNQLFVLLYSFDNASQVVFASQKVCIVLDNDKLVRVDLEHRLAWPIVVCNSRDTISNLTIYQPAFVVYTINNTSKRHCYDMLTGKAGMTTKQLSPLEKFENVCELAKNQVWFTPTKDKLRRLVDQARSGNSSDHSKLVSQQAKSEAKWRIAANRLQFHKLAKQIAQASVQQTNQPERYGQIADWTIQAYLLFDILGNSSKLGRKRKLGSDMTKIKEAIETMHQQFGDNVVPPGGISVSPHWCVFSHMCGQQDVNLVDPDDQLCIYTSDQLERLKHSGFVQQAVDMACLSLMRQIVAHRRRLVKLKDKQYRSWPEETTPQQITEHTNKNNTHIRQTLLHLDGLYAQTVSWAKLVPNNHNFVVHQHDKHDKHDELSYTIVQELAHTRWIAPTQQAIEFAAVLELDGWQPLLASFEFVHAAASDTYLVGLCETCLVVKQLDNK